MNCVLQVPRRRTAGRDAGDFRERRTDFRASAEATRLRQLGASPADVGQQDVRLAVLADPEGNEFCVLKPR